MVDIDFSLGKHVFDDTFDPTQKFVQTISDIGKFIPIEHPPYLEINAKFDLFSRYFNQITQAFEPFIEPWGLKAIVA